MIPPRTLVLLDLDGTLLRAHGLGRRSLQQALSSVAGTAVNLDSLQTAGRLDRVIFAEACRLAGVDPDCPQTQQAVHTQYDLQLEQAFQTQPPDALPGALVLIEALAQHPDAAWGFVTGNREAGALLKLRACGLPCTGQDTQAFGDEADDRAAMTALAVERFTRKQASAAPRVWVLGDTVHDMQAARLTGCLALGVLTGTDDEVTLREAGADHVLPDLSDTRAVLSLLGLSIKNGSETDPKTPTATR